MGAEKMLKFAKQYVDIGWSLIPVGQDKRPVISWKEFQERRMTFEEIAPYVQKGFNLAVVTGTISNITVLDDDSLKKSGFEAELLKGVNSPIASRTASGGHHYYFLGNKKIKNTVDIKGQAVDIRGEGGYVLLPPSSTQKGIYSWVRGKEPVRANREALRDLAEVLKIEDILSEKKSATLNYAERLNVSEGSRDSSLLALARSMFWRMTEEEVRTNIYAINQGYKPPLEPQIVEAKILQAKMYHVQEKGGVLTKYDKIPEPVSMGQAFQERNAEVKREKLAPKTGYLELDQAISGWTPGFVYILAGETSVGKTAIAANLAVRCSKNGGRVLYYSIETGNEIIDYLASARLGKPYSELTEEDRMYDDPNIKIYRTEVVTLKDLQESLIQNKDHFNLAIVDNIGFFEEKSNNAVQTQAELMRGLSKLALESGISILLIAHFNKPQYKSAPISVDRISGSKAFSNYAKGIFLIKRNKISDDKDEVQYAPNGLFIVAKSKRGENSKFVYYYHNNSALVRTNSDVNFE